MYLILVSLANKTNNLWLCLSHRTTDNIDPTGTSLATLEIKIEIENHFITRTSFCVKMKEAYRPWRNLCRGWWGGGETGTSDMQKICPGTSY